MTPLPRFTSHTKTLGLPLVHVAVIIFSLGLGAGCSLLFSESEAGPDAADNRPSCSIRASGGGEQEEGSTFEEGGTGQSDLDLGSDGSRSDRVENHVALLFPAGACLPPGVTIDSVELRVVSYPDPVSPGGDLRVEIRHVQSTTYDTLLPLDAMDLFATAPVSPAGDGIPWVDQADWPENSVQTFEDAALVRLVQTFVNGQYDDDGWKTNSTMVLVFSPLAGIEPLDDFRPVYRSNQGLNGPVLDIVYSIQ